MNRRNTLQFGEYLTVIIIDQSVELEFHGSPGVGVRFACGERQISVTESDGKIKVLLSLVGFCSSYQWVIASSLWATC